MSTNFPTSLDALANPTATDEMDDAGLEHDVQHANANDAIEALEAKVGVDGSAVTTSLDYKVANRQPLDADLTAIAALDSSTSGAIASDGAGWIKKTYAQFKTALSLVKGDVGLGNVDNTADTAKPVSTAQQTALDLKQNLSAKGAASGYASLNSSTKVVEDPANATATPTASKIPIADGSGKLDGWVTSGAMTQIGQTVLGSAAASITFTSIPATYNHLILIFQGRGTVAATSQQCALRFNGDTGSNYDYQVLSANNASVSGSGNVAQSSVKDWYIPGSTAPASAADGTVFYIQNYRRTTLQKTCTINGSLKESTLASGLYIRYVSGWWRNTAAINEVTVLPNANNFDTGTIATLYGLT